MHDYSFERAQNKIDNNYPSISSSRESVLKSRSPSGERVSTAREQDKFRRNKPSSSSQLPKLKLSSFDGNPLEWPEWSNMFKATVHHLDIPDSEKMSHLKTLLTGKAKSAISGMGYSGEFSAQAWELLGTEVWATLPNCRRSAKHIAQTTSNSNARLNGYKKLLNNN